ncbi:NAD(P)/FAD-dependent oxidoreductase [Nocardioides bruguierae]|uniref:Ferredoxin--NADP reductase n=1 Tax=Nocardioides bruguierae TaxID=2945102 RepID=A0A9X2IH70_9ACTN|nr:NAD(P)/FAD-dependent oxidoreductase [Nocardioides bruguierae]MCM0622748.1 NAD(P)/FAD-dependent oxidoreductase [Nocardioides bruguierae]
MSGSTSRSTSDPVRVDLAIVGAGPVGLYAAYYAGFRGMSVAVIDALEQVGGQMSAMYPEKMVYDVAGFPAVKAADLVQRLAEQAAASSPRYLLGEQVAGLTHVDDRVELQTAADTTVVASAVLLTAGIGSFTPRPLPAGGEYVGRGVMHFVPQLEELRDLDIVVVGGGDSAVDWALSLEQIASSVGIVHRRDVFRAHEASLSRLRSSTVEILTPYEVGALHGEPQLRAVTLVSDDCVIEREAQVVVAALGFKADLGPIRRWGIDMTGRLIAVDRAQRTSLPRVFAAGDCCGHADKVSLISVGFGEAATAVNHAAPLVHDGAVVVPGHSSDEPH